MRVSVSRPDLLCVASPPSPAPCWSPFPRRTAAGGRSGRVRIAVAAAEVDEVWNPCIPSDRMAAYPVSLHHVPFRRTQLVLTPTLGPRVCIPRASIRDTRDEGGMKQAANRGVRAPRLGYGTTFRRSALALISLVAGSVVFLGFGATTSARVVA